MERDVRRDRSQWKGCYSFKDIMCDGDKPSLAKRDGGLKMGQPYYFFYELDGSVESHDPSLPSTSACPYLPGQTVNTMWVPAEISDRRRSGSLSSILSSDLMTMNPEDKFQRPRPAPPVPDAPVFRLATSHARSLKHKRSSRSISPTAPSWSWSPRKLFTRKNSNSSQGTDEEQQNLPASDGSRSRDISPEYLHKFLSDSAPLVKQSAEPAKQLALAIPDDIVEEVEDDENFATSAVSESTPPTILSPPPSRRNLSATNLLRLSANASVLTLKAPVAESDSLRSQSPSKSPSRPPPAIPTQMRFDDYDDEPTSRFSFSSDESSFFIDEELTSPQSPTDNDIPSFYHSEAEDDDEDFASSKDGSESLPYQPLQGLVFGHDSSLELSLANAFAGYSLPRNSMDNAKVTREPVLQALGSPALIAARTGAELPAGTTSLLGAPARSIVDDLVNELSWIADVIQDKRD